MLEPVDIDINMNQNISDEAPKAAQASDDMTKSVSESLKEVARLEEVIKNLSIALEEQRKQTANTSGTCDKYREKIEDIQDSIDYAKKELSVYNDTLEQANKATQEGADVTDILAESKTDLSKIESLLVYDTEDLLDNQKDINDVLGDSAKNTDTYSASNQILSEAVKRVAQSLGLENTAALRAISNVHVVDAAKKGLTATTKSLTASQRLLAFTGIGAVVAAIGAIALAIKVWYDRKKELHRILNQEKNLLRESTAAVQEETVKVQILDRVLKDTSRTYNERNSALKQLKSIMPDYNAHLYEEGELIRDNTGALQKYIEKLRDQETAKRVISKLADAQTDYDEWLGKMSERDKKILNNETGDFGQNLEAKGYWNILNKIQDKKLDEINRLEKLAKKYITSDSTTLKDNTKRYWEDQKKQAEDLLATMTDLEEGSKKWKDAVAKYNEAESKLKTWDFKEKKPITPKTTPSEKASDSLEKKAYDYQNRIDNARVKAIQDGAERERATIKAEYDQTQAFIEKELKDLATKENTTGKPATTQRGLLLALDVESSRQYEAELARINAQSKATLDAIFTEVNARFASGLEQNTIDINSYYANLIVEAKKAGASVDEVNKLIDGRDKEVRRARRDSELEALDFETSMTLHRIENSDKFYMFESDRIKQMLDVEFDAARKRKAILEEQYTETPTDEVAKSLQVVNQNIEDTEKAIDKLPAEKFEEIANIVNQISNELSSISGVDLSAFSDIISGSAALYSGDSLGAISSGLGLISSFASSIFGNSERETEIKRELVRLQQEYNIAIRQQNYELISSIDYARAFRDNLEALHWLIEKGFISDVDYSAWDVLNEKVKEADKNILDAQNDYEKHLRVGESFLNTMDLAGIHNRKIILDWKSGLIDTTEALRRLSAAGWSGVQEMADGIQKSKEEIEKYKEELAELAQQMDEFATGTNFDGFLNDAMSALDNMRKGVGDLGDFTEDTLTNAILSSFKYQVLSEALKPFYDEMAKMFTTNFDGIDQAWATDWKNRLQETLGDKGGLLDSLFESLGIEDSSQRQGATGGFASASQDSINELTGGVYAVRQMVGDIRNDGREMLLIERTITGQLDVLVERSEDWEHLKELPEMVKRLENIETYGIKVRM